MGQGENKYCHYNQSTTIANRSLYPICLYRQSTQCISIANHYCQYQNTGEPLYMGDLFKRANLIYIRSFLYKCVGEWGPSFFKFIFAIQSNLYLSGIQAYFHQLMENFAEISVINQSFYYNRWEMKMLLL